MIATRDMRTSADLNRASIDATLRAMRNGGKHVVRGAIARRINLLFASGIGLRSESRFGKAERIEKFLRTRAVRRDIEMDEGRRRK